MNQTTSFANSGTLQLDSADLDGGSSLTIGGTLSNAGAVMIGNIDSMFRTTVTAAALDNNGTISLFGSSTYLTELISDGATSNTGRLSIGAASELDVTGSNIFLQNAGTTTVAGLLAAAQVDANGGLLDFTSAITGGDGTGPVFIGASGTLEFDAAVDSSHAVEFTAASGTLSLTAPGSFQAVIANFSGNDVIDLVNTQITGLSYSGNTNLGLLTVTGPGGTVAALEFGDPANTVFTAVSDGHGGTDILDPPAGPNLALLGNHMAGLAPSGQGGVTSTTDQAPQPQINLAAHA
jgi:hypothetical protein